MSGRGRGGEEYKTLVLGPSALPSQGRWERQLKADRTGLRVTLPPPHCPARLALSPMAPPVLQCPPPAVSVPGRECCRAGWWWVPCAGSCVRPRIVVDPMGTVCALWVSPWGPTVGLCGSCGSGGPSGIEGTWAKSCHMGDVLLHCRGRPTPAPQPALAGLWAQMCAPRGTNGPGTLYL